MRVPLVDLKIQYERIKDEVHEAWAEILDTTAFVLGPAVSGFEDEFARYSGVNHCIGVANGGDALEICLRTLDIGLGDEVIIPANTFAATAMAVLQVGATPVTVDVDPATHLMLPDDVEQVITHRTKAIIPVHLFGQIAPMTRITEIAQAHGLFVIEDAAQCQGATQNGQHAGFLGDMAATSFYPGKNLGAFGDGGAVLTNSDIHAERARKIRNYGGVQKYEHSENGRNSRLDALQAAVLRIKLRHLDQWNHERRLAAARYGELLSQQSSATLPEVADSNQHVWHLYVIKIDDRNRVLKELNDAGVGAGVHYPHTVDEIPGVLSPTLNSTATKLSNEMISLPIFPGITDDNLEFTSATLLDVIR